MHSQMVATREFFVVALQFCFLGRKKNLKEIKIKKKHKTKKTINYLQTIV
jgi:hypothetical protein